MVGRRGLAAWAAAGLLATAGAAHAATLVVTNNGDTGSGSLRAQITAASPGDTITFAPSVTTITLTSGELQPTVNMTIDGGNLVTIQSATTRVFDLVSSGLTAVTLKNLSLNGQASDGNFGGALRTDVGNGSFTLTIQNCSIVGVNTQGGGGAIGTSLNDNIVITGSTITGTMTAPPIISSIPNGGDRGGAIVTGSAITTIANSTIVNSSANNKGGAIDISSGTVNLINVTIANNATTTAGTGGGIFHSGGTLNLTNVVLGGNSDPNGANDIVSTGGTLNASHSLFQATPAAGITNGTNGNIVGANPLLGSLANNGGPTATIALLAGSPAIDAGLASACAAAPVNGVDQTGQSRKPAACTIGAFEADPAPPIPTLGGWAWLMAALGLMASGAAVLRRRPG